MFVKRMVSIIEKINYFIPKCHLLLNYVSNTRSFLYFREKSTYHISEEYSLHMLEMVGEFFYLRNLLVTFRRSIIYTCRRWSVLVICITSFVYYTTCCFRIYVTLFILCRKNSWVVTIHFTLSS